uniref:Reverse transcriptase zinc-binding domain-containing protein n=1 Tax=Manihot esculenta TaxID=3983 RepID=A0A2C9WIY1_MANES
MPESSRVLHLRWQVISPYFLNVWTEPWIPSLPEFKVSSIPPEDCPIMCVADLVDVQHMQLDQTILRECFTQAKCLKILKIPLSFDQRYPKLIWHFSRSGSPSVKPVYYNLKKVEDANQSRSHPSSSCSLLPGYWKSIWSLSIPHKIHVFLWRSKLLFMMFAKFSTTIRVLILFMFIGHLIFMETRFLEMLEIGLSY